VELGKVLGWYLQPDAKMESVACCS